MGKKSIAWTLVGLAALAGCLTLREQIKLNWDGSGTVVIHYELANFLALKRFGEKSDSPHVLPLSEEDLLAQMPHRDRLVVENVHLGDAGDTRTVDAQIRFKNIADLSQKNIDFSIEGPANNRKVWMVIKERKPIQAIYPENHPLHQSVKQALESQLRGSSFIFTFDLPVKPTEVQGGDVQGNSVTFTIPVSTYVGSSEQLVYSFRFKKSLWQRIKEFFLGPQAG